MLFATDKQTLDDLNIFGTHGGDSVFNMFNGCATRGGAAILQEMFRYPLSDDKAINRRSSVIRYFASRVNVFPFPGSLFDAIDAYMSNQDERTKLGHEHNSLGRKVSNMIAPDVETQLIIRGVNALTELLKHCYAFVGELKLSHGHPYETDRAAMLSILQEPAFEDILAGKSKPAIATIAVYDVVLRFRHRDAVEKLLRHIYYLDVYLAIAKVARERGFCFPHALQRNALTVHLEGVYHPQVPNAVPNSIHITQEGNVLFLTGANMAGKSTFMKSISIAMFLAHMGLPVAARNMEFAVLDGIYTTINLPDSLGMGASHFYAEVLRVKKIAQELAQGKNLFIVFDELFRGTNVKDAYEATIAITKGFAHRHNSLFVISTHIIEAGEVLKQACFNVRFVYLPTRMKDNRPVYTYTLEAGITDDRHGMIIINNERILDILAEGQQQMRSA